MKPAVIMKRRDFLKNSVVTTGALVLGGVARTLSAARPERRANDVVTLGDTGIRVSRLAVGTGTHGINRSSDQTRNLGIRGIADLLEAAYDEGVFFWDSADQYGTHLHLKEALKKIPREKVVILSKTHATTAAEMNADLDRFRSEIGTDYIDIMLLHCMEDARWPEIKKGAITALSEAREKGVIRAHGVSCHTLPALKAAAASPWVQVDMARINPAGVRMDGDLHEVVPVLKKMHRSGKGLIGMKILGGGQLTGNVDLCLRYALLQDYVDCFTIGMKRRKEMQDLIARIDNVNTKEWLAAL